MDGDSTPMEAFEILKDCMLKLHTTQNYVIGGVAILPIIYYFLKKKTKEFLIERTTIIHDLPSVGAPRGGRIIPGTAVICGGSLAGLFTARVCMDHFEDVVIIEPETWLSSKEGRAIPYNENGDLRESSINRPTRSRIPQYHSTHSTQSILTLVLRRLFPNIDKVIKESGGRLTPAVANLYLSGILDEPPNTVPPYEDYPNGNCPPKYTGSRESLEKILSILLFEQKNQIRWMVGTVTGVRLSTSDKNHVKAVDVRVSENGANELVQIPAALVIDCTGATQAGVKWLKRLHAENDQNEMRSIDIIVQQYHPRIRYANFNFPIPPDMRLRLPTPFHYDQLSTFYANGVTMRQPVIGYVFQWLDGHRVDVMLGGPGNPDLPRRPTEICDWLKDAPLEKPHPQWLYDTVDMLCENGDRALVTFQSGIFCSFVRYDLAKNILSNFIAIGDASMRLNPIYGQGISKICLDVVTLDKILRNSDEKTFSIQNFSKRFFVLQMPRIVMLWAKTKAYDYAFETTIPIEGETLRKGWLLALYYKLYKLSTIKGDKHLTKVSWYVRNFLAPELYMFSPRIIGRILWLFIKLSLGITKGLKKP